MFDDAELTLIRYLSGVMDIPVTTEVPDPRPAKFIRVMRTGNRRIDVAYRSVQLTVECWDDAGEAAAERFADHVEGLLEDWGLLSDWVSGPVPQPDSLTGCTRYVMTCIAVQHSR